MTIDDLRMCNTEFRPLESMNMEELIYEEAITELLLEDKHSPPFTVAVLNYLLEIQREYFVREDNKGGNYETLGV